MVYVIDYFSSGVLSLFLSPAVPRQVSSALEVVNSAYGPAYEKDQVENHCNSF